MRNRILLVDEQIIIEDADFEVTHAGSGEEALSVIDSGLNISLILMNIDLSEEQHMLSILQPSVIKL